MSSKPTTTFHNLDIGGVQRRYLVYMPSSTNASFLPVVIVLHGAGGTAAWTLDETGWTKTAEREGFLLIVPEGTRADPSRPAGFINNPQVWNDGGGHNLSGVTKADDVAFIGAMLDRVAMDFPIDSQRIGVTGFSNGAGLTFRLGTEIPERFAALAPVAGHLRLKDPRPDPALPTLYLIGTSDPLMPLSGGLVVSPWDGRTFNRPPVADTLQRWAHALGCTEEPSRRDEQEGIHIIENSPGRDNASLLAYFIDGLGHHWPGGRGELNPRFAGPPSNRINANDLIWDFFQRHWEE